MIELTQIEKPFGLLDKETQDALRAYEGEIEGVCDEGWRVLACPAWMNGNTYRAKPMPPKPRVWWVNVYPTGEAHTHPSREGADKHAGGSRIECVRVIECPEDGE